MGKIVFMFSGQGAQYPGMGKDLYEHSAAAKAVFDEVEKLRPGTIDQCFNGTQEELAQTINTQPCVYCVDLAAAAALLENGVKADMLAGFSFGEMAALTFSGAISAKEGFKLVFIRSKLMQEASKITKSAMAAVIKLSDEKVIALCNEFDNIYPVNFNCDGQVVVAGLVEEIDALAQRAKDIGGKALPLKVEGGFHSPFMSGASAGFADVLAVIPIGKPKIPIYSNVTAKQYKNNIKNLLAKQIMHPVMWKKEVENMIDDGARTFIEVGPGKTLCGLVSRISNEVRVFNVENTATLKKTLQGLEEQV